MKLKKDDRINETISGRSFQEQAYGAVSRRLKAKDWYYEIKSDGYLYFVLTEIPTNELDFAIEEAIKKVAEEERKKEQEILNSEAMLANRLKSARNITRAGNLLSAIKQLRELKVIAPKQPTTKRDYFIAEAVELEAKWLGSIDLIAQSGNDQRLEPEQKPEPLKVHVVMQMDNETIPVRNFPLVFISKQTKDITFVTDPNGSATLQLSPLNSTGIFTFVAIPDPELLQDQFPEAIYNSLISHKAFFKLEISVPFLKKRIKNDYMLKLFSSIEGDYKLGSEVELSASCAIRCRVRLYSWDGSTAGLLKDTGARKWIKNKIYTLIRFVPNEVGRSTLIAISTTGRFIDADKEGTKYNPTEFKMLINSFRLMNFKKAEEQLEFVVKKN